MVGEDLLKCVHTHTDTQKKQNNTKQKSNQKTNKDLMFATSTCLEDQVWLLNQWHK